jgi:hypothetical protein
VVSQNSFSKSENEGKKYNSTPGKHGILKYKIIELKNNTVLSEGKKAIHDIEFRKFNYPNISSNEKYINHSFIEIYDDFYLNFIRQSFSDKNKIGGIGIQLLRKTVSTFSWEWYNQLDTFTFTKLQGKGAIKFEYQYKDKRFVISKITFIGDQVLRCQKKSILNLFKDNWHCIIFDGSWIRL